MIEDCGCVIVSGVEGFEEDHIEYCPLHAAAPAMLEALKDALAIAAIEKHPWRPWHDKARDAVTKAEGRE